eukprot:2113574-Karenia_brevis.AAC.1
MMMMMMMMMMISKEGGGSECQAAPGSSEFAEFVNGSRQLHPFGGAGSHCQRHSPQPCLGLATKNRLKIDEKVHRKANKN